MEARPGLRRELTLRRVQAEDRRSFRVNGERNADAQRPTLAGERGERAHGAQLHDRPRHLRREGPVGLRRRCLRRDRRERASGEAARRVAEPAGLWGFGEWEWERRGEGESGLDGRRLGLDEHCNGWFEMGFVQTKSFEKKKKTTIEMDDKENREIVGNSQKEISFLKYNLYFKKLKK